MLLPPAVAQKLRLRFVQLRAVCRAYGMEDLMYGMERIYYIPYLHVLTWCC